MATEFKITITKTVKQLEQSQIAPKSWGDSLNDLPKIRETYASWNDPLSQRVITWIGATWETACSYSSRVVGIDEFAREAIEDLRSNILINTMDGTPVKEPKLDRIWTWENDDLQLYLQNIGSDSPYDGEKMQIVDHLFAQAMLQWIRTTPLDPLKVSPATEEVNVKKLFMWREMVQDLKTCKALDEMRLGKKTIVEEQSASAAPKRASASAAPLDTPTALKITQGKALTMFAPMSASGQFTTNTQEVETFDALQAMLQEAPISLEDEDVRENFSLILCSLLSNVVKPKAENIKAFERQIKELLSSNLPKGASIELFINSYREGDKEDITVKKVTVSRGPSALNPQQGSVLAILTSMTASGQFTTSKKEKESLETLQTKLLDASASLEDQDTREEFSHLLCSLLCSIIQPKGETASTFEREIRGLLASTLPEGESLELFIKSFEIGVKEKALLQKTDAFRASVFEGVNQTNEALKQTFEAGKIKADGANSARKKQFVEERKKVEAVANKVPFVAQGLFKLIKKVDKL